ncbi:MAG TPA: hypothetical protein VHB51_00210 [Candidatus Saccharimonadales bacterium]|nr:hypothetical protein [Candidatus Saccharimonadales bacterium]
MKYYILSDEEQAELEAIEAALDRGELKGIANLEREKDRWQQIAGQSASKTRNINIRLSERDLLRLQAKALEEGLPYQTLAASILHKSVARN